ncbi:MAG: cytochrome c [Vicinamibacterales bacterium]
MRRFVICAAVLVMAWAGTVGYAQGLKSEDDFDKCMKAIGGFVGAANKALQSGSLADAKAEVTKAKQYMGAIEAFFKEKGKADPQGLAAAAITKLGALETALGGTDAAAAGAAFKEAGASCGACHTKYRDQDPTTKAYSFKPGTL